MSSSSLLAASNGLLNFPPFYTRQPTTETWLKQQSIWADVLLAYCRENRVYRISSDLPIFTNTTINRKASDELYRGLVEYMLSKQLAVKRKDQQQLYALWMTEEQWAQELLRWAAGVGAMTSTIFTVYEMLEDTSNAAYRMDADLFLYLLEGMERRGLVQLLRTSDADINTIGVKFIKL